MASCGRGGTSCSAMVKDLAVAVFGRETLATHGLSGRAGNANKGTTAKPALDQDKVMLILVQICEEEITYVEPTFHKRKGQLNDALSSDDVLSRHATAVVITAREKHNLSQRDIFFQSQCGADGKVGFIKENAKKRIFMDLRSYKYSEDKATGPESSPEIIVISTGDFAEHWQVYKKMTKTWVLVEWREEPPTYDIVPKKDILKKKFEPGDVVDVAYEDESSPATIIDIDENKETLRRRMFRLEGKRRTQACVPNTEKRVAKKKKMYTPTQSPSSDSEPPMKHQDSDENNFEHIPVGFLTVHNEDSPHSPSSLPVDPVSSIIIEGGVVMDIRDLPLAVCLLFGLSYALHLDYPKCKFMQVILDLGSKSLKPKLQTLKDQFFA
ncbi:sterile alpha motif domain-containing 3-like isoform X2 [Labeo rohita]|uniref:Sterile alpha motif domain-containing 3-like isoform X2 n=1 Tax=Labeo rohita TaxID=84645 RepID=A0A498NDK7_LABRO|nr:sterile alpha motif domain-containing 3-like isoform X2 [Labeo rohita]